MATQLIDIGIAWVWQYDREFIHELEGAARSESLSTYLIEKHNLGQTLSSLKDNRLSFRFLLDRASDEDESFQVLSETITAHRPDIRIINPHHLQARASDKATMHLEFLARGIEVPYTLILSPYSQDPAPNIPLSELDRLGRPFIIKPANTTGGGIGVVAGAETVQDILDVRQHHQHDKYLLQETIKPAYLSENRGWFRVIYAFGEIFPCWWDDQIHIYEVVTRDDEQIYELQQLRAITQAIHDVCRLDFFSTEIVFTPKKKFVAVDYVNEICDMRMQSFHRDGTPDEVVRAIGRALVRFAKKG